MTLPVPNERPFPTLLFRTLLFAPAPLLSATNEYLASPTTAGCRADVAERLLHDESTRQSLARLDRHSLGGRIPPLADPLLPEGGRQHFHVVGGGLDPSVDCRWHW